MHKKIKITENKSLPLPALISYPKDLPLKYNGSNEPCDMLQGPCCCGAWHEEKEKKTNDKEKDFFNLPIMLDDTEIGQDGWRRTIKRQGTILELLEIWDIDDENDMSEMAQVLRLLRTEVLNRK